MACHRTQGDRNRISELLGMGLSKAQIASAIVPDLEDTELRDDQRARRGNDADHHRILPPTKPLRRQVRQTHPAKSNPTSSHSSTSCELLPILPT